MASSLALWCQSFFNMKVQPTLEHLNLINSELGDGYTTIKQLEECTGIYVKYMNGTLAGVLTTISNYLLSCVVKPEYRYKGCADALITEALIDMDKTEPRIYASAWINPWSAARSDGLLLRHGFTFRMMVDNYWEGEPCNHCGDSCKCSANLYVRHLCDVGL